ncbi:MAG: hypothetical protein AB7U29_13820 [Desulfobulbus sp.]
MTLVDFLPQETVAVIESKNVAFAYRQAQQGVLGRIFSRSDFPSFVQQFDLSKQQVANLMALTSAFNQLALNKGILSLLSRDSIVALLPLHRGEQIALDQLPSRLVFVQYVVSPKDDLQLLFSRCFGRIIHKDTSEFQGQLLTCLTFEEGKTIAYFTHMGVLVWVFEKKLLYPCVNQLLQHLIPIRAGIQKHAAYTRIKKFAGRKLDIFVYIRFNALQSLFGCVPNKGNEDQFPCPNDLAFFSTSLTEGQRFAVVAQSDSDKLAAYKKKHHLNNAVESAPLGRLSANTIFALWTNWFRPKILLEQLQQCGFSPLQTLLKGWSDDLSEVSGLSLADFFALFGSEFSLYVDQIRAPHQYPRSMVSTAIEVTDRKRVAQLLQQITSKLQRVEVLSEGMKIVTLMLADGLLQPAYSLTNNHLILADGAELIERIHEKVTNPEPLVNQSGGLRIQRSNFFLFLRTGDMVEWLLPVITTIGKEFGGHTGVDVNGWLLFQPLVLSTLSDLKQIETTKIRGYVEKNELFFEVISHLVQN